MTRNLLFWADLTCEWQPAWFYVWTTRISHRIHPLKAAHLLPTHCGCPLFFHSARRLVIRYNRIGQAPWLRIIPQYWITCYVSKLRWNHMTLNSQLGRFPDSGWGCELGMQETYSTYKAAYASIVLLPPSTSLSQLQSRLVHEFALIDDRFDWFDNQILFTFTVPGDTFCSQWERSLRAGVILKCIVVSHSTPIGCNQVLIELKTSCSWFAWPRLKQMR